MGRAKDEVVVILSEEPASPGEAVSQSKDSYGLSAAKKQRIVLMIKAETPTFSTWGSGGIIFSKGTNLGRSESTTTKRASYGRFYNLFASSGRTVEA